MMDELIPVTVGSPAPAFSLISTDGRTIGLTEYLGKSIIVIVFLRGFM